MTTIFDGYDEEYRTLTSDISKKLSEIASYEDQKGADLADAERRWDYCELTTVVIACVVADKKKASIVHVGDLLTQATQLASAEHRNRMAAATNKMKGTTDKLAAARKEIADTEEVALAIGEELDRNREKIKATHAKVKGVNEMARRGGNIVGRMSARDKRQRMALSIAAGFIIIAILLLIYFGIFKKK
ncbi:THO complex subunit 6 [Phytophthora nicotianae]|uniref:THO complex subunit 6 n=1 Tax=Phytophthora nicotianae TaxID=4792 RepID=A0A0W8DS44_PHYNI|nr:THO complex subunit 6 [Phytophthora nicotianae]